MPFFLYPTCREESRSHNFSALADPGREYALANLDERMSFSRDGFFFLSICASTMIRARTRITKHVGALYALETARPALYTLTEG